MQTIAASAKAPMRRTSARFATSARGVPAMSSARSTSVAPIASQRGMPEAKLNVAMTQPTMQSAMVRARKASSSAIAHTGRAAPRISMKLCAWNPQRMLSHCTGEVRRTASATMISGDTRRRASV